VSNLNAALLDKSGYSEEDYGRADQSPSPPGDSMLKCYAWSVELSELAERGGNAPPTLPVATSPPGKAVFIIPLESSVQHLDRLMARVI